MKRTLAILALATTTIVAAHANLISNGSFEAGNTGFSSDYGYVAPGPGALWPEALFTVDTNPNNSHGSFSSFGDHTTGSGNMMIINGAGDNTKRVWFQTIAVAANTSYTFSYWGASAYPAAPADLAVSVDGVDTGSTASFDGTTTWSQYGAMFTTGNVTSITLALRNNNSALSGNDFTLDDLKLEATPVPEPTSMAVIGLGIAGMISRRKRRA